MDDPNSTTAKWLLANGYGYLNETIPEVMKRTGATGPHFHIGLDSGLASKYAKRMNYKYNPKVVPNYTMPIPGNHIGPALPPVENNIVPDKDLLAQSETIDQQNEKIAKLDYTWQNLMQQEADAAKAAAEAKLKAEKDRQRAFGLNLAMGIIDNMGARNQQTQGTYAQNFLTPFINNLYSLNTAAYGGPIVATANKFELGGPETKVINGKTLTHATVPRTGEVRWVDLNDSRDFDGVTGYRWYDDAGNRMSYTQYRESPSSETNASKELVPIKHTLSDNTVFGKLQGVIDPDTGNLLFPGDENYNKVRMGYARGFYNPFSGGELKNNQYRTMPTNEEASRFADQYVAATEFKPWHLVTAPAKGLDILAPSRWVALMDDANDMGFSYLYDDRNPGFFIGNDPTKPFSKKFAQEHPYWAMAGNMVGDVAAGYGISKTLGAVGDVYNAGKTAIATSTNPNMQYVRYGLGKINGWVHGYNPKLPTLYRKVKGMPTLENGKVIISTPYNRFAYESGFGQESPLITNFSSDIPVRRHPDGNWNWAPTLAMPGESLLGKNVISTRPSDIFTFGDNISVPVKKVTAITGRQKELDYFKDLGIKTLTSPESQSSFGEDLATYMADVRKARARNARILERKKMGHLTPKRKWPEKDFNNYASEIQKVTRTNFRNPTIKDYEFMDYVFNPQYTSEVVPNMDITEAVTLYPSLVGSWFGNSGRRMYIANPDEWVNVMYDPYSPAEALFRKSKGIDLKPEWQNK